MNFLILVGGGAVAFSVWRLLKQSRQRRDRIGPLSERWLVDRRRNGEH